MKKVAKKFGGNKKSRTFALPFEKRGSEKDLRREIESGISSLEMLEMLEVEIVYNDYPTKSGSKKNFEKFFKKKFGESKKSSTFATPIKNNTDWKTNKSSLKRLKKQVQASTENNFNFEKRQFQISKISGMVGTD